MQNRISPFKYAALIETNIKERSSSSQTTTTRRKQTTCFRARVVLETKTHTWPPVTSSWELPPYVRVRDEDAHAAVLQGHSVRLLSRWRGDEAIATGTSNRPCKWALAASEAARRGRGPTRRWQRAMLLWLMVTEWSHRTYWATVLNVGSTDNQGPFQGPLWEAWGRIVAVSNQHTNHTFVLYSSDYREMFRWIGELHKSISHRENTAAVVNPYITE